MEQQERLGMVVSGSLTEGLTIRLDGRVSVEDIAVGRYVVVEGERLRFFGMLTNVRLGLLNEQFRQVPPPISDPFIAQIVRGTGTFGLLEVSPMLTLPLGSEAALEGPRPVKTIPCHFAPVYPAGPDDVAAVFGQEDEQNFYIGAPVDMAETQICLNLPRLLERSSGIFGKSGTGKTFLTRLLLVGVVQRDAAVSLIFDMHNEYGWEGSFEDPRYGKVQGLKRLFPEKVAIFTLDQQSSRRRNVSFDFVVEIPYNQVRPEDIEMLRDTLDLSQAMVDGVYRLSERLGPNWLQEFLEKENREEQVALSDALGLHSGSLQALHRKLGRLRRLSFLRPEVMDDSVARILDCLRRGIHVVLEFGGYSDLTAYVLVANLLTRRIHSHYVESMEKALGEQLQQPRPLLIAIEEAHKFLNPRVAAQTTFGTIAREMRKYNVTLLVVDQRPSSIDDEVMSQIGTRITYLLDDEKDLAAILTGVSGAQGLRAVLARLDSRKQALLLGHAVPMPVVIETREYGTPESYEALARFGEAADIARQAGATRSLLRSSQEEEDWL
ncbi:MAG: ATP-binding protein [Chloroflexia bacterium]|nr:ATP-binding protein [Chloroflexia bacterium]